MFSQTGEMAWWGKKKKKMFPVQAWDWNKDYFTKLDFSELKKTEVCEKKNGMPWHLPQQVSTV